MEGNINVRIQLFFQHMFGVQRYVLFRGQRHASRSYGNTYDFVKVFALSQALQARLRSMHAISIRQSLPEIYGAHLRPIDFGVHGMCQGWEQSLQLARYLIVFALFARLHIGLGFQSVVLTIKL